MIVLRTVRLIKTLEKLLENGAKQSVQQSFYVCTLITQVLFLCFSVELKEPRLNTIHYPSSLLRHAHGHQNEYYLTPPLVNEVPASRG